MTETTKSTKTERAPEDLARRILVGVDDSEETRAAVAYVGNLAQQTPVVEIVLAHAYEQWPAGTGDPTIDRLREETETRAQALVDGLADELRQLTGTPVRTVVGAERPGRFLGVLAFEADLIVVGQDTATLIDRLTIGSVAAHLAATAPCPVVIVPAPWQRKPFGPHPVVVALSGEDPAPAALVNALELASAAHAGVLALHAIPYFASTDEAEQHERELNDIVEATVGEHPGVEVTTMIVRGNPDQHLVHQSVNAQAVVVGRTRQGGPTAWMRSVAHSVIRRTHCPLIIVPTD